MVPYSHNDFTVINSWRHYLLIQTGRLGFSSNLVSPTCEVRWRFGSKISLSSVSNEKGPNHQFDWVLGQLTITEMENVVSKAYDFLICRQNFYDGKEVWSDKLGLGYRAQKGVFHVIICQNDMEVEVASINLDGFEVIWRLWLLPLILLMTLSND